MSKIIQKSFSRKVVNSQKKEAITKWSAAMVSKYPPRVNVAIHPSNKKNSK